MIDPPDINYIDRIETVDQSSNDDAASDAAARPIKLGDFSRLFTQLLDSPQHTYVPDSELLERSDYDNDYAPMPTTLEPASLSSTEHFINTKYASDTPDQRLRASIAKHFHPFDVKPISASERNSNIFHGIPSSPSDLLSSACRSVPRQSCICGRGHRAAAHADSLTSSSPECPECSPPANIVNRSRSWMSKLPNKVLEKSRVKEERHRALMVDLVPYRIRDASMARKYPGITSQGIHVFVDMSNIDIGYRKTLKAHRHLGENARLSPMPHLDLHFLNKILIRDRPVVALNVCCSTLPGRSEPRYVQQLRELGYHVDVRERKRIIEGGLAFPGAPDSLRFIEDLVDETLHGRIAESVMEYFRTPGTIVLATGDAKPSPHSDGFFAYIERALKMGWNVEIVSWERNLSRRWTDEQWTSQWHDKFRVLKLDDFFEVLK